MSINNKAPINYQLEATNDFVFKALFTHEPVVGHQWCKSFLEALIGFPIYHLEVAPCDIYSQNVEAKDIRLDISLWINQNIVTNIEMQINHSMKEIANRSLYYDSLLFTNQTTKEIPTINWSKSSNNQRNSQRRNVQEGGGAIEEMNKDERLRDLAYARKKWEMDERQIRYEGLKE